MRATVDTQKLTALTLSAPQPSTAATAATLRHAMAALALAAAASAGPTPALVAPAPSLARHRWATPSALMARTRRTAAHGDAAADSAAAGPLRWSRRTLPPLNLHEGSIRRP